MDYFSKSKDHTLHLNKLQMKIREKEFSIYNTHKVIKLIRLDNPLLIPEIPVVEIDHLAGRNDVYSKEKGMAT